MMRMMVIMMMTMTIVMTMMVMVMVMMIDDGFPPDNPSSCRKGRKTPSSNHLRRLTDAISDWG